jgi:hypothetical protein
MLEPERFKSRFEEVARQQNFCTLVTCDRISDATFKFNPLDVEKVRKQFISDGWKKFQTLCFIPSDEALKKVLQKIYIAAGLPNFSWYNIP